MPSGGAREVACVLPSGPGDTHRHRQLRIKVKLGCYVLSMIPALSSTGARPEMAGPWAAGMVLAVAEPRTRQQRKADTLAKLHQHGGDIWVASAGGGTEGAHLVPLSFAWIDERVVLATESRSVTARNIARSGAARLALGPTRDLVVIDAACEATLELETDPELADAYAAQSDWDPRLAEGTFMFLLLRPKRVQAWREANELTGRTLMRDGSWLP